MSQTTEVKFFTHSKKKHTDKRINKKISYEHKEEKQDFYLLPWTLNFMYTYFFSFSERIAFYIFAGTD